MRRYESIIILDPDLTEESRAPIFERFNNLIPQQGGFLVETDDWGVKKLAYEIKKRPRGHYVRLDYCGDGGLVDELERFCRIDDKILKYMTVLLDDAADLDGIKESLAQAEAEAAATAKAEAEAKAEATAKAEAEAKAKAKKTEQAEAEAKETEKAPAETKETPSASTEEE